MKTITFYSYKGGTGRSLALANAAIYLSKLGFRVVALDFDLEAPGLHYKLSRDAAGAPLSVENGIVDYVLAFLQKGRVDLPLEKFLVNATVPGIDRVIHLMPAGRVPSAEYWSKLSRINWHDLFYKKDAKGVQVFKELQSRISDELQPDYILIDSRTGITEMGGVATTLLADKVLCLVSPALENLEGSRAVLQSLRRAKREIDGTDLEITLAVSRLPEMNSSEEEQTVTERILAVMNHKADDGEERLTFKSVFVLHSEAALQVSEALRVGSGINPDESVLLRDYLRLFAIFVPRESIEPKVHDLIEAAWERLRSDPDAAVKEMEELTESFPHPENYRELLRFYRARNAGAVPILRRAQRLWEITRDSNDSYLWEIIAKYFEVRPRFQRREKEWSPNLSFVRAIWENAGARDPKVGAQLAEAYSAEDEDSTAADILAEIVETSGPSPSLIARWIAMLRFAHRTEEVGPLIEKYKPAFGSDSEFAAAWARHALGSRDRELLVELTKSPAVQKLRPVMMGLVYYNAGMVEQVTPIVDAILRDLRQQDVSPSDFDETGRFFHDIERWDDFEKAVKDRYPPDMVAELRRSVGLRKHRRLPPR